MSGVLKLLFVYILGGLTFIPLCIALAIFYVSIIKYTSSTEGNGNDTYPLLVPMDPEFKAGLLEETKGVKVEKSGEITITNQYYYHHTELVENPKLAAQLKSPSSSEQESDDSMSREKTPMMLLRSQLKSKQKFYVVLKHGNLFLYKEKEASNELLHAISLEGCFVTMWPREVYNKEEGEYCTINDGQLFTKRTCIAIFKKGVVRRSSHGQGLKFDVNLQKASTENRNRNSGSGMRDNPVKGNGEKSSVDHLIINGANQFFLYFENNMDKEDWYFKLINACQTDSSIFKNSHNSIRRSDTIDPAGFARTAHLNTRDLLLLIQNLNSTEGQLASKWFNALIGRLFLSLQQTDSLNKYLWDKIYKKLLKINKPGFLNDFKIEKVDVGNGVPFITNPKLLGLTLEGDTRIGMDLIYNGNLAVIISTKVNINLGSRFKPREVNIKISITVKSICGPLVILIKPPPSNRLWYAFQEVPTMDLDIEPVVSSSKLSYNLITNAIKSKFLDAIKESLVEPYMDDIVFFNTENEMYRGGIWDHNNSEDNSSSNINKKQDTLGAGLSRGSLDFGNGIGDMSNKIRSATYPRFERGTKDSVTSPLESRATDNLDVLRSKEINNDSTSIRSNSSLTSSNSASKGKKLLKTSISKINRWYKENVGNSSDAEEDDVIYDDNKDGFIGDSENGKSFTNTAFDFNYSQNTGSSINPTMISNRRKPVSKHVESNINKNRIQPPYIDGMLPNGGSCVEPKATQETVLPHINVTTPTFPANEMFINENVTSPHKSELVVNKNPNIIQNQFVEQDPTTG